ncbi:glycoside hydrolase family 108 protein [Paremcibacter congregatus]|uniref:glycoside hydrolase family 108 protein n=1 Tax=Paremcibacter congregatus TaxID=2043170 RepID=UPI0030EC2A86|tara:strand:+ start:7334 stop:7906 length:573 start_codon:yes stop_codon:yes gene_type:complete
MKNETDYENFNRALSALLAIEGALVDDPDDPGGITNNGISLRTLSRLGAVDNDHDGASDYDFNGDGAIDAEDIRAMSENDVRQFYYHEFWFKYSYGCLPTNVAIKLFDFSVNMGPSQAHKILQRALRANGHYLKDDGIIGNITRTLTKTCAQERIVPAMRSEAAGFYRLLAAQNPRSQKFLKGWLRRAYL